MQESLVLFESVINSRWFLRTSVILFLNKIDVFKQKLPKVPLVHYFPEYTGEYCLFFPSRSPIQPGRVTYCCALCRGSMLIYFRWSGYQ